MERIISDICNNKKINQKGTTQKLIAIILEELERININELDDFYSDLRSKYNNITNIMIRSTLGKLKFQKTKDIDYDNFIEFKNECEEILNSIENGVLEEKRLGEASDKNRKNRFILYLMYKKYGVPSKEIFYNFSNLEAFFLLEEIAKKIKEDKEGTGIQEKLAKLEEENNKLKNTLVLLEAENNNYEEENEELKEHYEAEALLDVFKTMNSENFDHLLDNFHKNEITLKEVRKNGVEVPQELESLVISTKLFLKFIKKNSIRPIEKLNKNLEISLSECEEFEYKGNEFSDDEIKNVIVETTGWKLGDKTISKPSVREVL